MAKDKRVTERKGEIMAQLNAAEKMLKGKKALIGRLQRDIAAEIESHNSKVDAIKVRIKMAQTLVEALQKGTLKP